MDPIRFHFDYISPYAYLAWTQIRAIAARHAHLLVPVPTLFAGLLNAHGQKGPAEIPPKRIYVFKECLRRAHRFGVPLSPPPSHPFNPLLALRVTSLVAAGAEQEALIDALYRATWGGGAGVSTPEAVAAAATEAGLDGGRLVAAADAPDVKARIRANTDAAIAAGVFGVPTMIVGGELFWGVDSLADLEAFLRGEDPVALAGADAAQVARWGAIKPSASRI